MEDRNDLKSKVRIRTQPIRIHNTAAVRCTMYSTGYMLFKFNDMYYDTIHKEQGKIFVLCFQEEKPLMASRSRLKESQKT